MKFRGIYYGMDHGNSVICHVVANQSTAFAQKPVERALCGISVQALDPKFFSSKRVCRSCVAKAAAARLHVSFVIPTNTEEDDAGS